MNRRDLALIAQTRAALADGSARERRITTGLLVSEIAAVIGVSPQAVSQWEHGQRVPSTAHALGYGKALAAVTVV
jgi:transcriptional regulator with XRE-family HTH domain